MRLYINSGTHSFTNTGERIEEHESHLNRPEVVFIEKADKQPNIFDLLTLFAVAPLLVGLMFVWIRMLLPILRPFFGDDTKIEQHIVDKYDAVKISVDAPKLELIREEWILWLASNWLLILSTLYFFDGTWLEVVSLLIIQGIAIFAAFVAGVQSIRNVHIAEKISENADSFSEAVLVTGKAHHEPVAELLSGYDEINVINPVRDESEI